MLKRLMIGLFALSVAAIWVSEASALLNFRRRSVGVTVTDDQAGSFVTDIFGLPNGVYGCGLIKGDVYCLDNSPGVDPLACDKSTGYSAALVLVTDLDFIKPKTKPYRWTDWELNSDIADFGQRRQLRVMEQLSSSNDPNVFTITLPVGVTVNKAGIHALSNGLMTYWKGVTGTSTDNEALRAYVGTPDPNSGILIPDDGFGTNTDNYLLGLPLGSVIPLVGNELKKIEGHVVCFVSNTDNVGGEDLHGKYRGTFAAKVLDVADDYLSVTMEVMDADDVCNLTLDYDYTAEPAVPVAGCIKEEKLIFAPADPLNQECVPLPYSDAYPEETGTISYNGNVFKGSVELELQFAVDEVGDPLCPAGTSFEKFIPKNFGEGTYEDFAFIGVVKDSTNSDLDQQVICGDFVPGGGDVEYSQYGCVPLGNVLDPPVIPDCCECIGWEQIP